MAALLRSSVSVVVGRFPRMKYIVATVVWSILRLSQIMLLRSRLLVYHGVALHLAQISLEDNHGDNPILTISTETEPRYPSNLFTLSLLRPFRQVGFRLAAMPNHQL
jgi:hypothetical protein